MHYFIAINEFKLELQSGEKSKICFDLFDIELWPLTLTFCMDITFVHGNNSLNIHDTMTGT